MTRPPASHNVPATLSREDRPALPADAPSLVLGVFLWVLIIASVAIALTALWLGPRHIFWMATAHALVDSWVLWRLRRGPLASGPFIVAFSLWAIVSYGSSLGRGTHDVGMVVLGTLMMLAALLRKAWQRWLVMTLTLAAIWVMGIGEITGYFKHRASHLTYWDDLIILSIIFAASAAVMRVMVTRLVDSLWVANASERNYKEIFNATHEAIVVLDCVEGRVLDANEAAFAVLAPGAAEQSALVGQSVAKAMGVSQAEVETWLSVCSHGDSVSDQRLLAAGNAKAFWCELNLRSAVIDGKRRVLAVLRDVDARHRLEDELRQADKLRALGHLAGGVAHDFNNQLTGILANAELVKLQVESRQAVAGAYVESIIKCALRSADLTRQLLAFARKARPRREVVNVAALVREVAEMLKRGLNPAISVQVQAPAEPLLTAGDPSLLHNALLNLGINGKQAMPRGGSLCFDVSSLLISDTQAQLLDISPGAYIHVRVQDTGLGMDEVTRAQIFDPFFTTKETGTGMGLAAAYGTIRSHGGALCVSSKMGEGSRFDLYLPAATNVTPAVEREAPLALPPAPARLRVLVVDDEPEVARTTADMLAAAGHQPQIYNNPEAALAAFRQAPFWFHLAVVDRLMPELSGDELLEQMRRQNATLPAVIVSGYSEAEMNGSAAPDGRGCTAFLPKPFGPQDLHVAISRLLDPPGTSLMGGEAG